MRDVHAEFRASHAAALQEMAAKGWASGGRRAVPSGPSGERGISATPVERHAHGAHSSASFKRFLAAAMEGLQSAGGGSRARSADKDEDSLDPEPEDIELEDERRDPWELDPLNTWEGPEEPEDPVSDPWPESCDNGDNVVSCGTTVTLQTVDAADFQLQGGADGSLTSSRREELHRYLQQLMVYYGVPGAALAVMATDSDEPNPLRLVHSYGFTYGPGFARRGYPDENPAAGLPASMNLVNPGMRFRIGSISKSITAAAILKLHDAYRLRGINLLNSYIADYFPIIRPLGPPWAEETPPIKVWHLLAHQSGITHNPEPPEVASGLSKTLPVTARDAVDYMHQFVFSRYEPGQVAVYNSYAYQVLGLLVEELTGEDYATYVTRTILEPFGMFDTVPGTNTQSSGTEEAYYYGLNYSCQCRCGTGCSKTHCETKSDSIWGRPCGRAPYAGHDLSYALATGGWTSTVVDLLRFMKGLIAATRGASNVLSARAVDLMWSQVTQGEAIVNSGDGSVSYTTEYGLGWTIETNSSGAVASIRKGGTLCGTCAMLAYRPQSGYAYCFLFNADLPDECRNSLRDQLSLTLDNLSDVVVNNGSDFDLF